MKRLVSTKHEVTRHTLILSALLLTLSTGCNAGVSDGWNDGLSAAVSALIQAPVDYFLDQVFNPA